MQRGTHEGSIWCEHSPPSADRIGGRAARHRRRRGTTAAIAVHRGRHGARQYSQGPDRPDLRAQQSVQAQRERGLSRARARHHRQAAGRQGDQGRGGRIVGRTEAHHALWRSSAARQHRLFLVGGLDHPGGLSQRQPVLQGRRHRPTGPDAELAIVPRSAFAARDRLRQRAILWRAASAAIITVGENIMPASVKQMLEAANAAVPRVSPAQAREMIAKGGTLVLDVRDAPEVEKSGKAAGALHVSRGMLEFRADPESPYHDKSFAKDKTVILYCASGGRAALAGKVLKDMGYEKVYNLGAFKDWAEDGGAIEKPVEPGT